MDSLFRPFFEAKGLMGGLIFLEVGLGFRGGDGWEERMDRCDE